MTKVITQETHLENVQNLIVLLQLVEFLVI